MTAGAQPGTVFNSSSNFRNAFFRAISCLGPQSSTSNSPDLRPTLRQRKSF
jgi:hypothetical protein